MEIEKLKVNDGGGLYDSSGLIDSLIVDCNDLVKSICGGSYIAFCAKSVEMVQKLARLKEGTQTDLREKEKIIADLKRLNDELAEKVYGVPVNKDAEVTE